ncbi:ABC transporter substrate-binding protein [Bauldia litoralis]|uniref:Carbohydrate ABC transporter substrate-binding protein, CUT1 family (TC 3.A.1.1.-) n=1 Tax=Bauldia litoralis TaxID=665467 RepID=A0A1G6BTI7_9HYPH|nr:extracellular solute-binding protein [Bauldia litoralis]SDB23950.1 carbohydrate ABC transporter substrate-binding protein, CUT1 family (TC 3.A.1.1.-) [Bauldia litoralis]
MVERKEQELLLQEASRKQLLRGQIDRREFLSRSLVAGLGMAGVGVAAKYGIGSALAQDRPLTPTFYDWIENLHPGIPAINEGFPDLNYQIAPVQGFGIERFVAEAKNGESTWDVYVGQTPFVEMTSLVEADVIEPWDDYIPAEVLDDMIPAIRDECTIDGKLYSWPFFLDVAGQGWHSGLTTTAGLPDSAPETWDDYLANAQAVIDSGAAPFGATFDAHGWRCVAPMAHSMSKDVYTPEGLFDFTSEPAIEALILMKKIMAVANPDILLAGATDGGVNGTPDEVAFAAQRVGYITKYFNAPLRMAQYWDEPTQLHLGPLPKFKGGEGSTVFWTTGSALFKHGQNKEKAAEYIKALTYDPRIWKDSIAGTETSHPGQLPPYKSIYAEWDANPPDWMLPFVALVRAQLDKAKAIENNLFGLSQFQIGQPLWQAYLTGEVEDPKVAMQNVMDAVKAERDRG